ALARRARPGHGALDDWPHGLARRAIERVHEALLRDLRERLDTPPVDLDVHQDRRCRWIEVPKIVAHHLEMPHALAGGSFHGDDALREQVVAQAMTTVHVARRRGDR